MRRFLIGPSAGFALAAAGHAQTAAHYPSKPIRFIVPYAPGGSASYVARLVGVKLTEAWGQQVLVDNKPGANTAIGSKRWSGHRPTATRSRWPRRPTRPCRTSSPTCPTTRCATPPVAGMVTTSWCWWCTRRCQRTHWPSSSLAKARPNELNFAAVGTGGSTHTAGEYFKSVAGVKMQHVPYKGTAPALTDLIGGQIQLNFDTPITSLPHIKSGRLKALAITGNRRLPALPDVPTRFAEAGLPAYDFQLWFGVMAPAGTPKPIVDKLSAEIGRVLAQPDVRRQLADQGLDAAYRSPADFDALVRADFDRFGKLIKAAGIKIE